MRRAVPSGLDVLLSHILGWKEVLLFNVQNLQKRSFHNRVHHSCKNREKVQVQGQQLGKLRFHHECGVRAAMATDKHQPTSPVPNPDRICFRKDGKSLAGLIAKLLSGNVRLCC